MVEPVLWGDEMMERWRNGEGARRQASGIWRTWIIERWVCTHYPSLQSAHWIMNCASAQTLIPRVPGFTGQPQWWVTAFSNNLYGGKRGNNKGRFWHLGIYPKLSAKRWWYNVDVALRSNANSGSNAAEFWEFGFNCCHICIGSLLALIIIVHINSVVTPHSCRCWGYRARQ